jgi:signal transduction histidine kinase
MASFRLETAPDEARTAFLIATFRLVEDLDIAALVDHDGALLVPPVSEGVGTDELVAFLKAIPSGEGAVFGAPIQTASGNKALPLVIPSPYGDDCVLAVRLSLGSLQQQLNLLVEGGEQAMALADRTGAVLVAAGNQELVDLERIRPFFQTGSVSFRYPARNGTMILAATAPAGDLAVIVAEPAGLVAEATGALESQSWFILGVALVAALAMGAFLTRSLTDPVSTLKNAVSQIGQGNYAQRIPVEGSDEIAELGRAFNEMAESLARSTAEVAAQKAEIEGFNKELQHRVEERTRELKQAQARLVQSQQLAAVAEVTSGVAHELNNPLAGILGILQVLLQLKVPDPGLLKNAEELALRCREILGTLTRFARVQGGNSSATAELEQVVADALVLTGGALSSKGVQLGIEGLGGLVVMGDSARLFQALGQLLSALKGLANRGAALQIEGARTRAGIELRLELSSTAASADDWQAAGLGFWAARQGLEEQGVTLSEGEDTIPPMRSEASCSRRWILRFQEAR